MATYAINGASGRIGLNLLTAFVLQGKLRDLTLLNDLTPIEVFRDLILKETPPHHQHLFQSVDIINDSAGNYLVINGHKIRVTSESEPKDLPLELDIEVMLEATGRNKDAASCSVYTENGLRTVISAPSKDSEVQKLIMGVNHDDYNPAKYFVTSNTSCTSNDIAMLIQSSENEGFGLKAALVLAPHAATVSQRVLAAGPENGALEDMVPASTGAASMLGEVFTDLDGHLDGQALRIGMRNGSVGYLTFVTDKTLTVEEINNGFLRQSNGALKGKLGYGSDRETVRHILGSPCSATFFPSCTKVVPISNGGSLVVIAAGYDNEFGYANRMVEHAAMVAGE